MADDKVDDIIYVGGELYVHESRYEQLCRHHAGLVQELHKNKEELADLRKENVRLNRIARRARRRWEEANKPW